MSTFRRIDSLLDGKTSEQLAREIAARERGRAHQDQHRDGQPSNQPSAEESPREQDAKDGRRSPADGTHRAHRMSHRPTTRSADLRPLVARTSRTASEAISGLVLAPSVIAISWYYGSPDAARVALSVLVTAVGFWLAHVYAYVVGRDVSQEQRLTRAKVAHTPRDNWSLIEVVIPLLLVLGPGEIDVITDTAAIVAATVIATVELAAAGAYAALRHGASLREVIAAAAIGMGLGPRGRGSQGAGLHALTAQRCESCASNVHAHLLLRIGYGLV